jgi:hypothetical protein
MPNKLGIPTGKNFFFARLRPPNPRLREAEIKISPVWYAGTRTLFNGPCGAAENLNIFELIASEIKKSIIER